MSQDNYWHFNVKRPIYLLDASLILASDTQELKAFVGEPHSRIFIIIEDGQGSFYVPSAEVEKQTKRLIKDCRSVEKIIKRYPDSYRAVRLSVRKALQGMKNGNYNYGLVKDFFDRYRGSFIPYRVVTRVAGYSDALSSRAADSIGRMRLIFKKDWTELRKDLGTMLGMIAGRFKVPLSALESLTYEELLSCLRAGDFRRAVRIQKGRARPLVLYKTKRSWQVWAGLKMKSFVAKAVRVPDTDTVRELAGRGACAGKVRGVVRVALRPERVPRGERFVLVTSMTTPDFVPMLRNALAIVTDEGGLTCHAAIISRELKIPCIIGTKMATRVLKSGDVVEVDAYQGIVRKIRCA